MPITAFGGMSDATVSIAALDGWRLHSTNTFRLEMHRGDHFFLRHRAAEVMSAIAADLRKNFVALSL